MFQSLSFQEKSAWVMFLGLAVSSALYFGSLQAVLVSGAEGVGANVPSLIVFVVVLIGLSIVGHILAALMNLSDTNQKLDERDKVAVITAGYYSGIVFALLVLMALGVYILTQDGTLLFHGVFAGLIVSQMVEYLLQIIFLRRVAG